MKKERFRFFKLLIRYNTLVIKYNALLKKTQSEVYDRFMNEHCEYYLDYMKVKKELEDLKKKRK